jgi:thiamine transport system permease protein
MAAQFRRYSFIFALPLIITVLFAFIIPYSASFWAFFCSREAISIWKNSTLFNILFFTLKQAFFSVLLSLVIGLPGAWLIGTRKSPLLRTLSSIPFAIPSILTVLGFVLFFGNSGWLNRFIFAFFGIAPLRILYKPEAVILAHAFLNFPLVIRLVGDGLARARKAYSPTAASLGASPIISAFTIILPLAFPSLISSSLLVFLYSFTSFAVVLVLGGGPASTTLSVEIYRYARIFLNYPNAGALAFVETLIAILAFLAYLFFGKGFTGIKIDAQTRIYDDKKPGLVSKIITFAYFGCMAIFVLSPILSIFTESFLYRPSRSASMVLSLAWWRSLGETCLPAFFRSLVLAFFSASLACAISFFGAGTVKLLKGQGKVFSASLFRFLAAAPLVSSGIVLGLGWLIVYGRSVSSFPLALLALHALIALPFAFNSISEGFRSLPENILNAALVSGAPPLRMFLTTALPLSLPRIRSAWGFAAALSLGELNAVIMLGIQDWETLPLYIYRAVGAYRYGNACAAGTLLILGLTAGLFLSECGRKKYG